MDKPSINILSNKITKLSSRILDSKIVEEKDVKYLDHLLDKLIKYQNTQKRYFKRIERLN